jgi:hypothetical protein
MDVRLCDADTCRDVRARCAQRAAATPLVPAAWYFGWGLTWLPVPQPPVTTSGHVTHPAGRLDANGVQILGLCPPHEGQRSEIRGTRLKRQDTPPQRKAPSPFGPSCEQHSTVTACVASRAHMGVLGDRLPSSSVSLLKKDDDASLQPAPGTRGRASVPRGRESSARAQPLLPVTGAPQQQHHQSPKHRRRRAALVVAATVLLVFLIHTYGGATLAHFQPEALRATFEAQGPLGGVALYVALFCTGELLHAPGLLFVAVGVLVWGCVRAGAGP